MIERIVWWQLVAPGYGLVDGRGRAVAEAARLVRPPPDGRKPWPEANSRARTRAGRRAARRSTASGRRGRTSRSAGRTTAVGDSPSTARSERCVGRDGREIPVSGGSDRDRKESDICRLQMTGRRPGGSFEIHRGRRPRLRAAALPRVRPADRPCPRNAARPQMLRPRPRRPGASGRTARSFSICPAATVGSRTGSALTPDDWSRATSRSRWSGGRSAEQDALRGRGDGAPDAQAVRPGGAVANAKQGLPFKAGVFDVVFSVRFFHHVHDPRDRARILGEYHRVTSGWAIVSFYRANGLHKSSAGCAASSTKAGPISR